MDWTPGDVSNSATLTKEDHLYSGHVNELRQGVDAVSRQRLTPFTVGYEDSNYNIASLGGLAEAWNAAIVDANGAGGGLVFLQELDEFLAAEIILMSGVHSVGSRDGTIIRLAAGANLDQMFRNENWTAGELADSDMSVALMTIDGNGVAQTGSLNNYKNNGFVFKSCADVALAGLTIREVNGFSINSDRVAFGDPLSYPDNLTVTNCVITKSTAVKYFWDVVALGCTNSQMINVTIDAVVANCNAFTSPYVKNFKLSCPNFTATNRAVSIETVSDMTSEGFDIVAPTFVTGSNTFYLNNMHGTRVFGGSIDTASGYCMSLVGNSSDVRISLTELITTGSWFNFNSGFTDFRAVNIRLSARAGATDGIIVRQNCARINIEASFIDADNINKVCALFDGVDGFRLKSVDAINAGWALVYLGSANTDVIKNLKIDDVTLDGVGYGVTYGPAIAADAQITGVTCENWSQLSPGAYAAITGQFVDSIIDDVILIGDGSASNIGIKENVGSSGNIFSNVKSLDIATEILLDASSGSDVDGDMKYQNSAAVDITGGTIEGISSLGVGTAAPAAPGHVNGANGSQLIASTSSNSAGGVAGVEFRYNGGVSNTHLAAIQAITRSAGGADLDFLTALTGGGAYASKMRLLREGNLGIGTTTPNSSALLDLTSTTGALLVPRMTTTQKSALTPVNGMIVYDASLNKFQGYENGAWASLI